MTFRTQTRFFSYLGACSFSVFCGFSSSCHLNITVRQGLVESPLIFTLPVCYSMYLFNVSTCISKIHLKGNMFKTECLMFPLNLDSSSGLFILHIVENQKLGFCLQNVSRIKPCCHLPSLVPPLSKSLFSHLEDWRIDFPGFCTCSPTGFSQNSSQHSPFKIYVIPLLRTLH